MKDKFDLKILLPEGLKYEKSVEGVILPGKGGEFEVKANHISLISPLKSGKISIYESEDNMKNMAISGGICKAEPDNVKLILKQALFKDEIDVTAAKEEKNKAEKKLKSKSKKLDKNELQREIDFAEAKIDVAK